MAKIESLKDFNRNQIVTFKQISADPLIGLKKYDGTNTGVGASLDKNGYPVTGLTEDQTTRNAKGQVTVIPGTRKEMERLLDMTEGSLKQRSVFWLSYSPKVPAEEQKLNLEDDHDLLKFLYLSAQSHVACSLKEIEKNSKAEFVLYSADQEAQAKVSGRKSLKDAYAISEKLDLQTKMNILAVHGIIADATQVNVIENKIDELAEGDPAGFLELVEDGSLELQSLVRKCMSAGVLLVKDGGSVYHGDILLGHDTKSSAQTLNKNAAQQRILRAKLSGDLELLKEAVETKD